ncbi:hypothetical protein FOMPIDRAFT_117794 [Fomitopsis schrenkii]|uniref:Uncharacterized protein n=1 Tax=Fomitopsis schrenkii TaxID=2126942 RepID=S8DH02_FOMSC|nr:hypothetical protein FOMPIDRAFT_117794 [Fomitopsis schrenkii]
MITTALQYAAALRDVLNRLLCKLLFPIAISGSMRVMFANHVEDFRLLISPLGTGSQRILISSASNATIRAGVMFVLLPNGRYSLSCRNTEESAAMIVTSTTEVFLHAPTFAIRLLDVEAYVQLQLTFEAATDFWLFVGCLHVAKTASSLQRAEDEDDHGEIDSSTADVELLAELLAHFDEYMKCRLYTTAELQCSEFVEIFLMAFILGILFRIFMNIFILMSL